MPSIKLVPSIKLMPAIKLMPLIKLMNLIKIVPPIKLTFMSLMIITTTSRATRPHHPMMIHEIHLRPLIHYWVPRIHIDINIVHGGILHTKVPNSTGKFLGNHVSPHSCQLFISCKCCNLSFVSGLNLCLSTVRRFLFL